MKKFSALLLLVWPAPAMAQQMQTPHDVDYGASGLVQFKYECPTSACEVRCFMTGVLVLEVKQAKQSTFSSYRSHNRQNAPEKEISVVGNKDDLHFVNFSGDGGCVFSGMRQVSTAGFLARTKR
jgi:hypothetical protein